MICRGFRRFRDLWHCALLKKYNKVVYMRADYPACVFLWPVTWRSRHCSSPTRCSLLLGVFRRTRRSYASHVVPEQSSQVTIIEVVALLCIRHSGYPLKTAGIEPSSWVKANLCINVFLGSSIPGDARKALWYWIRDSMSTQTLWASCQITHDHMQPYNSPIRNQLIDNRHQKMELMV